MGREGRRRLEKLGLKSWKWINDLWNYKIQRSGKEPWMESFTILQNNWAA
jgi:hypothetical protein